MSWGQVLWSSETGCMGDCWTRRAGVTPRLPAVGRAMEEEAGVSSGEGCPSPHPHPPGLQPDCDGGQACALMPCCPKPILPLCLPPPWSPALVSSC